MIVAPKQPDWHAFTWEQRFSANGTPYPRKCWTCGLGPENAIHFPPTQSPVVAPASSGPAALVERLRHGASGVDPMLDSEGLIGLMTEAADALASASPAPACASCAELRVELDGWVRIAAENAADAKALQQSQAQEITTLRGAMAAQDERERLAGERCGVSALIHGCDWPDAMAEKVLAQAQEIATLTAANLAWREAGERFAAAWLQLKAAEAGIKGQQP